MKPMAELAILARSRCQRDGFQRETASFTSGMHKAASTGLSPAILPWTTTLDAV